MDPTPFIPGDRQLIEGFAPGYFLIRGVRVPGAAFVFPDRVLPWIAPGDPGALTPDDFRAIIEAPDRPDLLLLGTGPTAQLPAKALRAALREAGLIVEAMDSRAACRTHNILLAEDRSFVTALMPL